jgi:cytidylate kinase
MYRAVAWAALCSGISIEDEPSVTALAEEVRIDVRPPSEADGRTSDVLIDGEDVTWQVRQPEVDTTVSIVSAYPGVRNALTAQQRRVGLRGGVVMVGRDIGTVVLPEAAVKIYLDASVEVRARRRYLERQSRGESVSFSAILEAMRLRDQIDSTRAVAPLRPAEDAIRMDSDHLDADQVLEHVLKLLGSKGG